MIRSGSSEAKNDQLTAGAGNNLFRLVLVVTFQHWEPEQKQLRTWSRFVGRNIHTDVALPVILVVLKSDHKETKARQARQKLCYFLFPCQKPLA